MLSFLVLSYDLEDERDDALHVLREAEAV
jgi:hypothetical protein